jgi:hypothetical protein
MVMEVDDEDSGIVGLNKRLDHTTTDDVTGSYLLQWILLSFGVDS